MALVKNLKLTLVEKKEINVIDSSTGELIKKMKFTFFDSKDTMIVGYSNPDSHQDWQPVDAGGYDPEHTVQTQWIGRVWDGQTNWRLLS